MIDWVYSMQNLREKKTFIEDYGTYRCSAPPALSYIQKITGLLYLQIMISKL
ncbi:hypothetical protein OROHE_001424 [Orobanche hederae]